MKLDVYDFDGTIYSGDSTIDFYLYCLKHNIFLIRFLPVQILYLIKYKMKLVEKLKFKEKFFSFLKGIKDIDKEVELFWDKNEKKIRYELIKNSENTKYIISASPKFLLQNISKKIGDFKLITSKVDKKTGNFIGKNCYGEEKVKRLKEEIGESFEIEKFYSDSISDEYLARLSKESYWVNREGKIEKWKNI